MMDGVHQCGGGENDDDDEQSGKLPQLDAGIEKLSTSVTKLFRGEIIMAS